MKRYWSLDELIDHWTLTSQDLVLLEEKTAETKLLLAVLLKAFPLEGCFPNSFESISMLAVDFIARQLELPTSLWFKEIWNRKSGSRLRVTVRKHHGFRQYATHDDQPTLNWLQSRVLPREHREVVIQEAMLIHWRTQRLEPPSESHQLRLLRKALHRFEVNACQAIDQKLSAHQKQQLLEMLKPSPPIEQRLLPDELEPTTATYFVSMFHELRVDANQPGIESIKQQIAKLVRIRSLNLTEKLFENIPLHLLNRFQQRASLESPSHLQRHSPFVRHSLMTALCWQRHGELIDTLIEHLLYSVHTLNHRAERRVDAELIDEFKHVTGKGRLLYQIAIAALEHPEDSVRQVVFAVANEERLRDIIKEYKSTSDAYKKRVQSLKRNAYRGHYRRVVPMLLQALEFRSNNALHQPIINALETMLIHADTNNAPYYPSDANVPLEFLTFEERRLVREEQKGTTLINRVNYELTVLEYLRTGLRCREIWVIGANKYRNPDQDLPQDFDEQRTNYYAMLEQPKEAEVFIGRLKDQMRSALKHCNDTLPDNLLLEILERDDGWIKLSPLEAQPEPKHLTSLKSEIASHWQMTGLLEMLKETELRCGFTRHFKTLGAFETLDRATLQKRLLMNLYATGTNMGLKRMASADTGASYAELRHVRKFYLHRQALRAANIDVVNAIRHARQESIWGVGSTACASDSKQFGAWDQNLITEWHQRYGGRGVMVYWHVEKKSVCVHSQLKTVSSSEVAAMLEGVLRHCTDVEIERQYVDTHGQSEVGFAFAHCLGFHLMPRLKDIHRQRLYLPEAGLVDSLEHLRPVLRRSIDWTLIAQQYDEIIKFTTALRLGTADAESVLRRFTRSNIKHPTYKALAELGKAVKTIYLCDYLSNLEIRREVQEGLNVMENWNSANGFIFFGKGSEFQSNRFEEQELSMLCMHLLQNSLIFVNTLMIQQVLAKPEVRARMLEADWRGLTPLIYHHVNPYGVFHLDFNSRIPLEDVSEIPLTVAGKDGLLN